MQIRSLHVRNFKSLADFSLQLEDASAGEPPRRMTFLVGLNGTGKSTVLQFFDLVGRMVDGSLDDWFGERGWKPGEIRTHGWRGLITFHLSMDNGCEWSGSFSPNRLRLVKETIETPTSRLEVRDGKYRIRTRDEAAVFKGVDFLYRGSILSQISEKRLPPDLAEFADFVRKIHSLETLTPDALRTRTREAGGTLGHGGRNLASFLHELDDRSRARIEKRLKKAYPRLGGFATRSIKGGWKQLEYAERYGGGETTPARHASDGMLRLTALLAELQGDERFILLDEIENGINPELVELVLGAIRRSPRQVLLTTHSPLVLNYLTDEEATSGAVVFLYRNRKGGTCSIPLFSIPSMREKLRFMGPGEAFADTDLTRLPEEIGRLAAPATSGAIKG